MHAHTHTHTHTRQVRIGRDAHACTYAHAYTYTAGADRFGRSKGIGIVSARSAAEAQELVRLLDGSELLGRTLQVGGQGQG